MSKGNNINYLVIALSNGKLFNPSLKLFKKLGIDLKSGEEKNRKLTFFNPEKEIEFIITRPKDNPTYVEYGAADIGIVGEDVLLEENKDVYKLLDLKFGKCKMVLAAPAEIKQEKYDQNHGYRLKVATKYPVIAGNYFKEKGIYVELIKLYGSVELAPQVGLADVIVDIVSTGRTLKDNKLVIREEIMPLSAQFIVNRISYKTKHQRINEFLKKIEQIIALESAELEED
ncbi:MAG: ATP phosphoribosyltransferase [Candidatus Infernicultor aquiphilus]|uniref:ATP phosphoribosyltransferase n=1 Tax=Candidatus Infernicultor aquiphilus TaxID=1805029 RepID=A0A1J5GAJ1_9BACT|nr:ATP phosphoribosyltransferase [bacterium]OIP69709.1 MAG: ATP phosphoribosyltransferase [Candidatus Atribacteria bacterium CG2_30_33_13]PIU25727.1 MAG: ATP phosphoribosyltransferase [Candidatus Atribacteria bacterium CG08_land_8_20_14_0_20_33_29]PIW11333.1 MAG: ATP phosphoribosyltransferase [Candidatus Atribacteria bacterium CG17_big_fil_post_rev_8_21_14_2_50_34_11]PIX34840.1 MAG: ATP phosphoribosyltransferase [Candidatus Atribacteria bacterium CG_4_8_14_3_um_filter_34_18]PIY32731.1 MAG: ATP